MYLKYLTIKGFKSFADSARVRFSPGLTVVVGPNGSGKSNVVDALAWVLGAQGPKQLRSSKMEDVIFAGSEGRAPLGRAEVLVTFDNSDERLSLKLNEVSISRSLYRSGESSYKLNGVTCRLSELVDLLGEVGVGKSQHLIISQGEVDDIVNARPEEIRVILEEAAGVTRYKRRRDVALKRLLEVDSDLEEVVKLERDLKRRIKPLEKQYESARLRDELIGRQRSLSLWIAKMELDELKDNERRLLERREILRGYAAQRKGRFDLVRSELSSLGNFDNSSEIEANTRLKDRVVALDSKLLSNELVLTERVSSLRQRSNQLSLDLDSTRVLRLQRTRDDLEAKLKEEGSDLLEKERSLAELSSTLLEPEVSDLVSFEEEVDSLRKDVLERRSALDRMEIQLTQERSTKQRLEEDLQRVDIRYSELATEAEKVGSVKGIAELRLGELSLLVEGLVKDQEKLLSQREAELDQLLIAKGELSSLDAEVGALRTFQGERARSRENSSQQESLLDLYEVPDGFEFALEAALGPLSQAIVVENEAELRAKYQRLSEEGNSGVVVSCDFLKELASERRLSVSENYGDLPSLLESLEVRSELPFSALSSSVVLDLVSDVYVVEGYNEAVLFLIQSPTLRAVTKDGHIFSKERVEISLRGDKALAIRLSHLDVKRRHKKEEVERLNRRVQEVDSQLGEVTTRLRSVNGEVERLKAEEQRSARDLSVLSDRLDSLVQERKRNFDDLEAFQFSFDLKSRDLLADELRSKSIQLRDMEERLRGLRKQRNEYDSQRRSIEAVKSEVRLKAIEVESDMKTLRKLDIELKEEIELYEKAKFERDRQLSDLGEEIDLATTYRSQLQELRLRVGSTLTVVAKKLDVLEEKAKDAVHKRRALETEATSLERELDDFKTQLNGVEENLNKVVLTQQLKEESLSRYLGVNLSQVLQARALEGVAPTVAKDELERTETRLQELGAVNPYAAIELEALREELKEVEMSSLDVKSARREIRSLLTKLDEEMRSSFVETFRSVEISFGRLFERLFPGGRGSLKIAGDLDVLESQIDIDIEIPGKKVRRLSLLSGGERSLVGLAFLFAIFETKPTPFVVLDEVEAALDDRNLSSFIDLLNEFRTRTQIIVVTHQKRTMEIADVLVGVSSTSKGSSQIIREDVSHYEDELI